MKANVYIGTSLDGYIARKSGDIDWLVKFANEELVKAYNKFMAPIDAIVIGRGTFEKILSFPDWPYNKPAFFLSKSIKQIPNVAMGKITLLDLTPKDVLSFLEEKGLHNFYIDGGKVIQSFLNEDLIDEMTISTLPILIGSGIPLFGDLSSDLSFKLLGSTTFSNGVVQNYYQRSRA